MKPLATICIFASIFYSCSNGLSKSDALNIIAKDYPKEIYYQVFTLDPNHVKKMQDAGFVSEGFVRIEPYNGAFTNNKIVFTTKSQNLLLPTPDKEQERQIQRVKTAEHHLLEVTDLQLSEDKAMVEYSYQVRNLTPYSKLYKKKLVENEHRKTKAYFIKDGNNWRLDRTGGLEYLVE
ncbi:hypothetical protein [Paraflavitalea sp. CAU 1676]|uniref:hypothetical protein n=1 Tax=Paraflavitalea sp. CAU 1676 TaxID=3032598 RepID=UPI0023DA59C9|nr:hypothetical protein [Paraflavitalea sp. CAU 1676]MDF2190546.1 hypothetical protein [Paraflavitalea sp. CAU 1676]